MHRKQDQRPTSLPDSRSLLRQPLSLLLLIGGSLLLSFWLGAQSGIPFGGLYGTASATIGMLMVCAYVLAMDSFGPIADNAGGIVEMSQAPESVRKRMDKLDAAGNTTKALTKGYAIGSAALAVFLLLNAYMSEISILIHKTFDVINIASIPVFVGALFGAMLIFVFAGLAITCSFQNRTVCY